MSCQNNAPSANLIYGIHDEMENQKKKIIETGLGIDFEVLNFPEGKAVEIVNHMAKRRWIQC